MNLQVTINNVRHFANNESSSNTASLSTTKNDKTLYLIGLDEKKSNASSSVNSREYLEIVRDNCATSTNVYRE